MPREADQLLVMDRLSGRWAYLPAHEQAFLELLGTPAVTLGSHSPGVAERVASLRELLIKLQIGTVGAEKKFGRLNTIILKLTNACNLACAYCYDFEKIEKSTRLELGLARKAMDQAMAMCEGTLSIILHGGEPMLVWPFIEQIVFEGEALARERQVDVRFTGQTNMTRLTQRAVDFSDEHDITWGVSLDGIPAINDRFRTGHDGTGSFDLFLQALQKWPDFVRRSSVMTTVTAANESLLLEAARYFRSLGMAGWDWSLFQPIGRGRDGTQFHIDIGQLCEAWDQLFEAVVAGEFHGFPVQPVKKYLDNFWHGPGGNMCLRPQCGAARDLLSISANGTIEACDCIDPRGPLAGLGHLSNTTLAAARSSPVAEAIRSRDMSNHPQCASCVWYGVCGGTCVAHAGRLDAVWQDSCAVALLAFDRISNTLANSTALQRYVASLAGERLSSNLSAGELTVPTE